MGGKRCVIIITSGAAQTLNMLNIAYPEINTCPVDLALAAAKDGIMIAAFLKTAAGEYLEEDFTTPVEAALNRIATEVPAVMASIANNAVDVSAAQVIVDSIAEDLWTAAGGIADAFDDED